MLDKYPRTPIANPVYNFLPFIALQFLHHYHEVLVANTYFETYSSRYSIPTLFQQQPIQLSVQLLLATLTLSSPSAVRSCCEVEKPFSVVLFSLGRA